MTETCCYHELLDAMDSVSQKLTSQEYKTMVELLSECKKHQMSPMQQWTLRLPKLIKKIVCNFHRVYKMRWTGDDECTDYWFWLITSVPRVCKGMSKVITLTDLKYIVLDEIIDMTPQLTTQNIEEKTSSQLKIEFFEYCKKLIFEDFDWGKNS